MKSCKWAFALLGIASLFLVGVAHAAYEISDGSVKALWHFNGNSVDSSTYARNSTDTNMTYATSGCMLGSGCASFNGASSYITFDGNTNLPTSSNPRSISMWINFAGGTSLNQILDWGTRGTCYQYWRQILNEGGGNRKNRVDIVCAGANNGELTALSTNAWHHFVTTYDGTTVVYYLDGTQDGTSTMQATPNTVLNSTDARIGSDITDGNYFNGKLDEVAIFNKALASSTVSNLYNNGNGQEICVAAGCGGPLSLSLLQQYKSDGVTTIATGGTTTENTVIFGARLNSTGTSTEQLQVEVKPTGFPFTGSPNVTSTFVSPGSNATTSYVGSNSNYHWQARIMDSTGVSSTWQTFGLNATSTVDFAINYNPVNEQSVNFNGSSSWAWPGSALNLNDSGAFTIEFWYKAATSTAGDLIDARSTSTGQGWTVSKDSNGIHLALSCDSSSSIAFSGAANDANHSADAPPGGPYWHHVAITKSATTSIGGFKLNFDGAEAAATNCLNPSSTSPIWFSRSAVSSTDGFIVGKMEEVRIWNIERSSATIAQYAQQEISPTSTGLVGYWTFNGTSTELVSGNATSGQNGTPTFSSSSPIGTHFIDFIYPPSVHNGKIRWASSTQYLTQWNAAVDTWNAQGPVVVTSTVATSTADLIVDDVNSSTSIWAASMAAWFPASSTTPSAIDFNTYYLSSSTSAQIQNTATHELGHALGLDHSVFNNVMYYAQTTRTTLGSQDISDYNYLWGN